jgi:PAS domain S-box-containing protein
MDAVRQKADDQENEDLRSRCERFEAIVDMAGAGIIILDSREEIEYVNDMVTEITNYSKIEIYRGGLSAFLPEKSLATLREVIRTLNGRGYAEVRVVGKMGKPKDCDVRIEFRGSGEDRGIYLFITDITEQKQMEAEIRMSEEKYGHLFESIHHGIFVSSKEGKFLDCNPAMLEMLGYNSKEEFLALNLARDVYTNPQDRERFQRLVKEAGYVKDFEVVYRKKSGEEATILLSARALRNEMDEITGYQGIMIDITERKRKEDRAREVSEERYRRLFEGIRDAVYISSREGRFIDCNVALLEMLGYEKKEEFLSLDIAKNVYKDPGDRRRFQEIVERDGYVKDHEVVMRRKNGDDLIVLITGQTIRNDHGEVMGYEGIMKDITQRNLMEKNLAEVNEFLNMVIEASPDAMLVTDRSGDVIMYNAAAEQLLGYPFGEVVGRKARSFNLYPRRLARRTREMIMEDKSGRKGILRPIEFYVQDKSGNMIETSLSASILCDDKGDEIGSIAIFKDMRELARIKRRLQEIQNQLIQSERLAAMGRLTSQIAHEVNNPLYGIMNTLELLKAEIPESSRRRKLLDMSLSEIVRLTDMLKNMLTFSRPGEEARKDTDINGFIEGSLMLMEKQLMESGINLVTGYGEGIPAVSISPNQMRQVIINITKNAAESMPQGGTLTVTTGKDDGLLKIMIHDTGMGMSEEVKKQIFDAFFTTKEQVKGVGLGLSVCYGIVRDHGGEIQVESQPGKGSLFTVALPITAPASDAEEP